MTSAVTVKNHSIHEIVVNQIEAGNIVASKTLQKNEETTLHVWVGHTLSIAETFPLPTNFK